MMTRKAQVIEQVKNIGLLTPERQTLGFFTTAGSNE